MKLDASREPFGFPMSVLSSTRRALNTLVVTDLKLISTLSFIIINIFALAVPYLFYDCFLLLSNQLLPIPVDS